MWMSLKKNTQILSLTLHYSSYEAKIYLSKMVHSKLSLSLNKTPKSELISCHYIVITVVLYSWRSSFTVKFNLIFTMLCKQFNRCQKPFFYIHQMTTDLLILLKVESSLLLYILFHAVRLHFTWKNSATRHRLDY